MKKTRLLELVREIINEELELESQASDDAKRQGLEYIGFGRWGKDGKTTHVTQSGKLVPVKNKKDAAAKSGPSRAKPPEMQRYANKPKDVLTPANPTGDEGGDWEQSFGDMRKDRSQTTPAHTRVVSKIQDKLDTADLSAHYNKTISTDDFQKATGIPKNAAKYYYNHAILGMHDPYVPYTYHDDDTITVYDPDDVDWESY